MIEKLLNKYRDNRLSYQLLLYILLFSTGFTLLISALQLYVEYRKDIEALDTIMNQVRSSFQKPIEASLWDFDAVQIKAQLNGVMSLPHISKVQLFEVAAGNERPVVSIGEITGSNYRLEVFPLVYGSGLSEKRIGTLKVFAGMEEIYIKLIKNSLIIFLAEVLKIFLLSFFVLLIFHHLIMKHLIRVSGVLKTVDIENSREELMLEREKKEPPDILDRLVGALNDIRNRLTADIAERKTVEEKLRRINAELITNRSEIERQNQIKTGQMTFAEILRGDQAIETLAQGVISYLCRYLEAGAGIFYLVSREDYALLPKGRYGTHNNSEIPESFPVGEGLVGQVVTNKAKTVLSNITDHYFKISSTLGEESPRHILIHPFILNGDVRCVVEIATFEPLNEHELQFMDSISESVAIATESAQIRYQRTRLLEELKGQTRELSEREMAFRRSEEKFKLIFNNSSLFIGLLDSDGRLVEANRTLLEFTGYNSGDIEGVYIWDAPWWTDDEKKGTMQQVVSDCTNGFETEYEVDLNGEGGGIARICFSFRPVRDEKGMITQVIAEGTLK